MLTALLLLYVSAFIAAILSKTTPHVELWVSVLLLCIAGLLQVMPLGR